VVRGLGMDVHRDFCEVAIAENGRLRSAGRIPTRVPALELFAQSLAPDDVVALEATTGADRIVGVLERHGVRVVVANTRKLKSITEAKAKTDRLDARTLAKLLMCGLLDPVWTPDERTRALRRLTNRRERIVRARTRAKNEAHGVLSRNLCERPPVTDAFGKAGRRWLASLQLPVDERLTLDGCLRQVDFLDGEIAAIEARITTLIETEPAIAEDARLLRSAPGVGPVACMQLIAQMPELGQIGPKQVAALAGLAPLNVDSGTHRGKRTIGGGRKRVRDALYMAALNAVRRSGSFRSFYQRLRTAGKPAKLALIAVARKLLTTLNAMLRDRKTYIPVLTT